MKWGSALALLFVFGLLAAGNSAVAGDICDIRLDGEIDSSTLSTLEQRYNSLKNYAPHTPHLCLNSTGGDMEAAMRAGDFVRQKKIWTMVADDDTCASACVLLFLGGVKRFPHGKIGLHRPFSTSFSKSETEAKITYERINSAILQYLKRMNIPEALLNTMNGVPPGDIKWLNIKIDSDGEQLYELHIIGTDPVYADQKDSSRAEKLGISKKEYYSRDQRVKEICDPLLKTKNSFERYRQCFEDVMDGKR